MDLNTNVKIPEWLTEERISELRNDIAACPNPYTKEELMALPFDGGRDLKRYHAYSAIKILTEYGLM